MPDITGSIQVKNNKWYAVLNLRDEHGKRKLKWISLGLPERNNKRNAERRLREILIEYNDKNIEYDSNMLFYKLVEMWLETMKTKVRESTYVNYKTVVNAHIVPYFKNLNIKARDLCPHHLEEYYALKSKTLSNSTLSKHHANIHSALEYGRKNHIVNYNVAKDVTISRKRNSKTGNFYTDDMIKKLVDAVTGDVIETPVIITCQYGLRRSEALGLKWDAIDFKTHKISIRATLVNVGSKPTYVENTKSEASNRTLHMTDDFEAYLKSVQARQNANREKFGDAYKDEGFVCTQDDGEVISPTRLSRRYKKLIERNGLPEIRFHDLRHSAATNLLAKGFNVKDVSTWLGHADVTVTLNIYGHVLEKSKVDMANALNVFHT